MTARLLDDRSEPPVRHWIAGLLGSAVEADFAVSRIRLGGLDLSRTELAGVRRCRVLLGRLDAETLADATGAGTSAHHEHLQALREFLESGRLEVRTAGLTNWTPDFSIFRGLKNGPTDAVTLVGAHYFARLYPTDGPAFTCLIHDPAAVAQATMRFDELWENGYDVAAVVRATLDQIERHPATRLGARGAR